MTSNDRQLRVLIETNWMTKMEIMVAHREGVMVSWLTGYRQVLPSWILCPWACEWLCAPRHYPINEGNDSIESANSVVVFKFHHIWFVGLEAPRATTSWYDHIPLTHDVNCPVIKLEISLHCIDQTSFQKKNDHNLDACVGVNYGSTTWMINYKLRKALWSKIKSRSRCIIIINKNLNWI